MVRWPVAVAVYGKMAGGGGRVWKDGRWRWRWPWPCMVGWPVAVAVYGRMAGGGGRGRGRVW